MVTSQEQFLRVLTPGWCKRTKMAGKYQKAIIGLTLYIWVLCDDFCYGENIFLSLREG